MVKIIVEEAGIISESDKEIPMLLWKVKFLFLLIILAHYPFISYEGHSFSPLIGGIVYRVHRQTNCNCISWLAVNSTNASQFSIKNKEGFEASARISEYWLKRGLKISLPLN